MAGRVITPEQFLLQWTTAAHALQVNAFEFEGRVGAAAVKVFQKSFDMHRFNTAGSKPWKQRSPHSRATHPLMNETGTLKRSITWEHKESGVVSVYTAPSAFHMSARHKGFVHAKVHNEGLPINAFGHHMKMPKRQFIGHSTVLKHEITKLFPTLFKGFPK